MRIQKITICGGGNGAQTLAPIAASNLGCAVDIYAPLDDEAQRLRAGAKAHGSLEASGAVQAQAQPHRISANPAMVIPNSDVVLLVLPAFAHESTLRQITPYLKPGARVGAIPARGGFDYCAASILQEANREDIVLFGLQTLPWACRIEEYGRRVHVLGVKKAVDAASRPSAKIDQIAPFLEQMLGLEVGPAANLLALTLANTGQIIHPGIMYSLFAHWNGEPFHQAPPFYQGLDEQGANVLAALSEEVQTLRARLANRIDLSAVYPLQDWLLRAYGEDIADPSTLHSAFVSNRAYAGLKAPVQEVSPGRYAPDFGARYLTEDVPFGLAPTRAIAHLAGVETPVIDQVIAWAGGQLGRDYLGCDALQARIPQKYGLETLEQLIDFSLESEETDPMSHTIRRN
jgi:hypothetical protein